MGWWTYKIPGLGKFKVKDGLSKEMHDAAVRHELTHLCYPHLSEREVRRLTKTNGIKLDEVIGLAYPKRR